MEGGRFLQMDLYAYRTTRMLSFFAGSIIRIFLSSFALRILKVMLMHTNMKND